MKKINECDKTCDKMTGKDEIIEKYSTVLSSKFEKLITLYKHRTQRFIELNTEMKKFDLCIRTDSRLCCAYVYYGDGKIKFIVKRMCQMKYLFDYCDIATQKNKFYDAYNQEKWNTNDDDLTLIDYTESKILKKIGGYPRIWPWIAEKSAKIIQKKMMHWLWSPYTKDGRIGLMAARGMRECGIEFPEF